MGSVGFLKHHGHKSPWCFDRKHHGDSKVPWCFKVPWYFKIYGLLFSHFITWVKKVRGVFNINAILSLNFEISRRLSTPLL